MATRRPAVPRRPVATFAAFLALLFGLATSSAAWAQPSRVEFTPFGGYRFGGSFKAGAVNQPVLPLFEDLEVEDGFGLGLITDITLVPGIQLELVAERQNTGMEVDSVGVKKIPLFDLYLYYLHGGVIWEVNKSYENKLRPLAGISLGATVFDPKGGDRPSEARLSVGILLGVKYFPGDRFGLRAQTRLMSTYMSKGERLFCNENGECYTIPETSYMTQIDISGGIIVPIW